MKTVLSIVSLSVYIIISSVQAGILPSTNQNEHKSRVLDLVSFVKMKERMKYRRILAIESTGTFY